MRSYSCGVISPLLTRENYRDRPTRSDVGSLTESSEHKVNARVRIRLPFVDEHLRDRWPREFMEYSSRERIQGRAWPTIKYLALIAKTSDVPLGLSAGLHHLSWREPLKQHSVRLRFLITQSFLYCVR
jgi:hypothetical protein